MDRNEIRKTTKNVLILFFLVFMEVSGNKWSYEGEEGPEAWHESFPACSGKKQSPINIISKETLHKPTLTDFAIWFDPPHPNDHMVVINTGHTVKVKTVGKFYLTNGGLPNVYKTAELHFHWGPRDDIGSEHQIDSVSYPLELHIVNYDHSQYSNLHQAMTKEFGLAVLGVMFRVTDEDNPALNPILDVFDEIQKPGHPKIQIKAQSIRNFLPKDASKFYRYFGSLTTPACHENVIWTIFKEANYVSHRQMKKLRELFYNKEVGGHPEHHSHHHDHEKLIELAAAIFEMELKKEVEPPSLRFVDNQKTMNNNSEENKKQTELPAQHIDDILVVNDTKEEITTHTTHLDTEIHITHTPHLDTDIHITHTPHLDTDIHITHTPHLDTAIHITHEQPDTQIVPNITDVESKPEELVMGKKEVVAKNNTSTAGPIEEYKPTGVDTVKNDEYTKQISGITNPKPLESSITDKKETHVPEMQRDAGYVQLGSQKQRLGKHKRPHHHHHHRDHQRKKRDVQGEETHDDNPAVAAAAPEEKKEEIPEKETNFLTEGDKKLEAEIHKSDEIFKRIEEKMKSNEIRRIHIVNNYRPIQPLNGRRVLRSFPSFDEESASSDGYGLSNQQPSAVCAGADSITNAGFYLTLFIFSFIANILKLA